MGTKRNIEFFSAGCPACETTISRIRALACVGCRPDKSALQAAGPGTPPSYSATMTLERTS